MFCPNCGTTLPNGSKFCTNCGAKIGNARQSQQNVSRSAATGVAKKAGGGFIKKLAGLVLAGAVVVGGVSIIQDVFGDGGDPVRPPVVSSSITGTSVSGTKNNGDSISVTAKGVTLSIDKEVYSPGDTIKARFEGVTEKNVSDGMWIGVAGYLNAPSEFRSQGFLPEGHGTASMKVPNTPGQYQVRLFKGTEATEANLIGALDFTVMGETVDELVGTWEFDEVAQSLARVYTADYVRRGVEKFSNGKKQVEDSDAYDSHHYYGKLTITPGSTTGSYIVTVVKYCDELPGASVIYAWDAEWDAGSSSITAVCQGSYEGRGDDELTDEQKDSSAYPGLYNIGIEIIFNATVDGIGSSTTPSFTAYICGRGDFEGYEIGTAWATKLSDQIENLR